MCAHSNYVNTTSTRDQVLLMLSALDTLYHLEGLKFPGHLCPQVLNFLIHLESFNGY